MKVRVRSWFISALLGSAALLVAACGSGNEESGPATPGGASPANGAAPTSAPLPTVDPSVPLVGYESRDKGYAIGYPEGWEIHPGSTDAADYFTWSLAGGQILAQLSVTCETEAAVAPYRLTPDGLILRDAANVIPYGGEIDSRAAVPVRVSGVEGKQLVYAVHLGDLEVEHIVAYAVIGECGWRIGLNTFGAGSLAPFVPLFERIVDSFHTS
jgi:hypothetical protein